MLGKAKKALVISACLLFITGCSQLNPSVDDMSKSYQTVIEKFERNSLFLNVVRSSKNLPLSFMSIPSITGTGSVGETVGLSANVVSAVPTTPAGFLSPTTGTYYSPSLGVTLNRSFTFTQSSLDNEVFQRSFMSDIPLASVNVISNMPEEKRELIYSLIFDKLVLVSPAGVTESLDNNPLDPSYPEFQKRLHELMEMGLSTEMQQHYEPVGTLMTPSQVNDTLFRFLDVKDAKRLIMREQKDPVTKKSAYQMYQKTQNVRFCFEKTAQAIKVKSMYGAELFCHDRLDTKSEPLKEVVISEGKNEYELGITIRSTAKVFTYLGHIVTAQSKENPTIPTLWSMPTVKDGVQVPAEKNVPILVVSKNKAVGKVFAEIDYEGDAYIIPAENAGHSTQVMSLLRAIVALNKVPGAIPQSPTVLIK